MSSRDEAMKAIDEVHADGARFVLRVLRDNLLMGFAGIVPYRLSDEERQQIRDIRAQLHPNVHPNVKPGAAND